MEIKVGDTVYDRNNLKVEGIVVHIQEKDEFSMELPDAYYTDAEKMKSVLPKRDIRTQDELWDEPDDQYPDPRNYDTEPRLLASAGEVKVRFRNSNATQPDVEKIYGSADFLVKKDEASA